MEQILSDHDVVEKELHPLAVDLAKKYVGDFAASLLLESKAIATNRKADIVLSSHIEEALTTIKRKQEDSWGSEFYKIIGSALFGAFIQGFVSELQTGNNVLIVTYTVMGFIGMALIFLGFRK